MIELTLTGLAMWSLAGTMVIIVFFSWISRWSNRNAERRSLRQRMHCPVCLQVYEDPATRQVGHCPNCGAANERGRNRSLG